MANNIKTSKRDGRLSEHTLTVYEAEKWKNNKEQMAPVSSQRLRCITEVVIEFILEKIDTKCDMKHGLIVYQDIWYHFQKWWSEILSLWDLGLFDKLVK